MEMIKVESSTINSIGWENDVLYVEYRGGTYMYEGVNRDLFLQLLGSKSRGSFMNKNIQGKFNYKKIK